MLNVVKNKCASFTYRIAQTCNVIHCKSGSSGLIYLQQIIKQGKLQQVPHNLSD